MKTVILKCNNCNQEFEKEKKEYNRQLKKNPNYKFYCSISCSKLKKYEKDRKEKNEKRAILKWIYLNCSYCKKEFKKSINEYKVKVTNNPNYQFCCSRSCAGKLSNIGNIRSYSPYTIYMRSIKNTKKIYTIDEQYLKKVWNDQTGTCPYLKIKLNHRANKKVTDPIYTASLDRIDSTKGYIKGNVQFVSLMCNLAKNKYEEKYLFDFFNIIQNLN